MLVLDISRHAYFIPEIRLSCLMISGLGQHHHLPDLKLSTMELYNMSNVSMAFTDQINNFINHFQIITKSSLIDDSQSFFELIDLSLHCLSSAFQPSSRQSTLSSCLIQHFSLLPATMRRFFGRKEEPRRNSDDEHKKMVSPKLQ